MACERYEPHLVAYADGELEVTLFDEVAAHLKICRECREAVRDLKVSAAILRKWQPARPTRSLIESIRERIEAESAVPGEEVAVAEIRARMRGRTRAPSAGRRLHVPAIAAAVLLAVGLTLVFLNSGPASTERTSRQRIGAMISAAQWMKNPAETAMLVATFDDVVADQLLSPRPSPDAVIQAEVVSSMIARAATPRQRSDVIRIMQIMGEEGRLADARRRFDRLAWGAGECVKALFSMSAACADDEALDGLARRQLDEAMRLEGDGELEAALEKYRQAASSRRLKVQSLIQQAGIHMMQGDADVALDKLKSADVLTRERSFHKELIAELRLRAERAQEIEQKIAALRRDLLKAKDEFEKLSEIGTMQVQAGNMKQAVETWDEVARGTEGSRSLHARLLKGWCLRQLGRKGDAAKTFTDLARDAVGADADIALLARFERAKTLQLANKDGEGLMAYQELVKESSLTPSVAAALKFQIAYIQLYGEGTKAPREQDTEKARQTLETLKEEPLRSTPFGRLAEKVLLEL